MQAERTAVERKYALIRLAKGDYLLPSNDAKTLWRIRTYIDGPSYGLLDWSRDKGFWGVQRWTGSPIAEGMDREELEDPARWEWVDTGQCEKRSEAIEAALRAG